MIKTRLSIAVVAGGLCALASNPIPSLADEATSHLMRDPKSEPALPDNNVGPSHRPKLSRSLRRLTPSHHMPADKLKPRTPAYEY